MDINDYDKLHEDDIRKIFRKSIEGTLFSEAKQPKFVGLADERTL